MIFPGNIFKKIDFDFHPVWVLVAINVAVFLFIQLLVGDTLKNYTNDVYLEKTSKMRELYLQTLDPLEKTQSTEISATSIIRDSKFWYRAENFPFKGDQVKIADSKQFLKELKESYLKSPQFLFGLSPSPTSIWAWITYQFLHTSFFHLLMNMLFLYLIVGVMQTKIDQDWIYAIYVLSGLGGGYAYLWMNPMNEIAVVGASGAICGLMGFMSIAFHSQNMEWSYFLSPVKGYYGIINLPVFLLFPMYLISDFTTVLYYNTGVQSSVAHSAHIGGTLVGCCLGALYLVDQRAKKNILAKWGHHLSHEEFVSLRDKIK